YEADWDAVFPGARCVRLPGYAWQRERFWFEEAENPEEAAAQPPMATEAPVVEAPVVEPPRAAGVVFELPGVASLVDADDRPLAEFRGLRLRFTATPGAVTTVRPVEVEPTAAPHRAVGQQAVSQPPVPQTVAPETARPHPNPHPSAEDASSGLD